MAGTRAEPFLAACVQMRSGDRKADNLERASGFIEAAVARGARLVVLPEVFSWRGPASQDPEEAEAIDGPTVTQLRALAQKWAIFVVGGSILEKPAGTGGLPFNTSFLIDDRGAIGAIYRKMHLFDVTIPGKVDVRESARRAPGEEIVCVPTRLGRIGLSICYDLRFPELYRALTKQGAEIITIPSAFTAHTGAAHWHALLRARAIENQCYVLAPNQIGPSGQGHHDFGHSSMIDPWGTVIACAPETEGVIYAEIDLGFQARVRSELPCLQHTRIDR